MDVLNLKISTQRTNCLFLYCGVVIALLFVEPYGASATNNTDGNKNITSVANVVCPSGRKCFDSVFQNVSVVIGYNGKICPGQSAQECYNESDPRGFVRGPRQHPVVIYQGDRLILKPQVKFDFAIKVYNVSRSAFDTCNFTGATKVIDLFTKLPFELPKEFIQTVGFKYFIVESDNMVIQCQFGLKLEVSVRSRDQCVSPSPPKTGVCSSKGLCAATYGKFFTYNASCVCDTGYLGSYCEERDSCHTALNPCHNGATCIDRKSGLEDEYNCSCVSGYDGKNCENNIDDCQSQTCKNGGICIDDVNKYKCLCAPGYFGTSCENLSADKCELKPCQNGGTCKRTGENRLNYTCICVDAFTGMNCTENVTMSSSIFALSSVITTTGKSSSVSDGHSQTLMLDTTHLSLKARFTTTLHTALPSLSTSVEVPISSKAMPSSFTLQKASSTSKYSVAQSLVHSTHLSVSSLFTLEPSLTKAPFESLSTHSSSLNSLSLVIVTEDIQGSISSVLSKASPLSITPLSSLGNEQMSSISSSSFMKTTSLMSSTVSSALLKPSSWSITTQAKSSGTVQTASIKYPSFTNTTFYIPSTTLASSVVTSSVFSTTVTPSLTSLVASSSQLLTAEPSTTSTLTFSNLSLSRSSTRSSIAFSTQIIPTSTLSAAMTSSVYPTTSPTTATPTTATPTTATPTTATPTTATPTTATPTTATPTTATPTTATPTILPPTTVPLKEQTCRNMPCNNGTCQDVPDQHGLNFTCQCPQPSYGPRCSIDFTLHFPRFSSNSYLVHKPIAFVVGLNKIVITFKTTAANGLLLYSTHSKHADFIQLYIIDGKLEYRFDPGDYLCIIKSPVTVNTDKIVTAVMTYDSRNKEGSLQVDNNAKLTKTSLGKLQGIGLYNNWYIGGLPPSKKIGGFDGSRATISFIGCIKDIELNGNQIGFEEAIQWNDLSECDTPCNGTHKPCQNNGHCIPDAYDPHEYECKCLAGFKGKNCKSPSICSGDPCKGGLCILDKSSTNTSKICLCPFGRGGRECENELNISVPTFTMVYDYPSFIQYQVPTLSGPYFEVSLQFKIEPNSSSWDNALLVFSGQNQYLGKGDDFIALGINNSRILFQYNLGSGIANIWSDVIDGTREWHSLTAFRKKNKGYLFLDNQKVKEGSSPGDLTGLNLYSPLFLGGVADLSELPADVSFKRGLEGSIINAAVRFGENKPLNRLLTSQHASGANKWPVMAGRNIGNEGYSGCNASQPCQNNGTCSQKGATITCSCVDGWKGMYCANRELPCVNYNPCATNSTCREVNNKAVCDCPLGKSGDTCSSAISIQQPRFKENSYMAFTLIRPYVREITEITIKFIPYNENGLLFYIPFKITSQKGDFLSISLHNGFVQYRYNLGSGIDAKQSRRNISLNNEHTVIVTRNKQIGTIMVDEEEAVAVRSPGKAVALDVSSNFYLGGVPQLSSVNPLAVPDAKSLKDFVGCVVSVTVNGVSLTLTETGAVGGRNVDNCPASKSKASDNNLV